MMMFATGFLVAMAMMVIASTLSTKYAIKRGWYASAIWSEEDRQWKVRGSYLSIAQKIHNGIRSERIDGKKHVKYYND